MSEWQPIETAPKDGTRILATGDGTTVVTLWGKANHVPLYSWLLLDVPYDPEDYDFWKPTHWQPLPPPPTEQEKSP